MAFLIECRYRPGAAEARFAIRGAHLEYMIAALPVTIAGGGGLLADDGAAIGMFVVLNLEDRTSAQQFVAGEPYNAANLFESVKIIWLKLMTPEPEKNFLAAALVRQRRDDLKVGR